MFGSFRRKPEPSMADLFASLMSDDAGKPASDRVANTPEQLRAAYAVFSERYVFKPGDLVMWKEGQQNRRTPAYGEPVIVVEFLETPVISADHGSGTQVYREPLDLICGEIIKDGQFACFHYDSRRFQPYRDDDAAE